MGRTVREVSGLEGKWPRPLMRVALGVRGLGERRLGRWYLFANSRFVRCNAMIYDIRCPHQLASIITVVSTSPITLSPNPQTKQKQKTKNRTIINIIQRTHPLPPRPLINDQWAMQAIAILRRDVSGTKMCQCRSSSRSPHRFTLHRPSGYHGSPSILFHYVLMHHSHPRHFWDPSGICPCLFRGSSTSRPWTKLFHALPGLRPSFPCPSESRKTLF
jgi:hypothetical protein